MAVLLQAVAEQAQVPPSAQAGARLRIARWPPPLFVFDPAATILGNRRWRQTPVDHQRHARFGPVPPAALGPARLDSLVAPASRLAVAEAGVGAGKSLHGTPVVLLLGPEDRTPGIMSFAATAVITR